MLFAEERGLRVCFNPRTRGGCDKHELPQRDEKGMFQSTHPRGVRHKVIGMLGGNKVVSIHAPAGGATCLTWGNSYAEIVSIHAPAGGAT